MHDPGDHEREPDRIGHGDGVGDALVRMDATEEHQPAARSVAEREVREIDAVINGRGVAQIGVAVRVADRDVRDAVVVASVNGTDPIRRKTVDRRHERGRDEPRVCQRKKVVVVVDKVERAGMLERVREMEGLPDLRVERGVFHQWPRADRVKPRRRDAVRGREQRDVDASLDEPLREEGDDELPGAVVARRYAPRDRREHSDAQGTRLRR